MHWEVEAGSGEEGHILRQTPGRRAGFRLPHAAGAAAGTGVACLPQGPGALAQLCGECLGRIGSAGEEEVTRD